jgi:hypothetical protein
MEKIMYFLINNDVFESETDLKLFGYPDAYKLTKAKYDFAVANPNATIQEKKDGKFKTLSESEVLESAKMLKLAQLQTDSNVLIQQGYFDAITGLTLFLDASAVDDYSKLKAVIQDYSDNDKVEIGTTTGWHEMTKKQVYELLQRYGKYSLENTIKFKKLALAIQYATLEQLENITW